MPRTRGESASFLSHMYNSHLKMFRSFIFLNISHLFLYLLYTSEYILTNDGFIWFSSTFSIKIKVVCFFGGVMATQPEQIAFGIACLGISGVT